PSKSDACESFFDSFRCCATRFHLSTRKSILLQYVTKDFSNRSGRLPVAPWHMDGTWHKVEIRHPFFAAKRLQRRRCSGLDGSRYSVHEDQALFRAQAK